MARTDGDACALEMAHVGKRFGQNWVLRNVNLKVRRGSIHAIVGHNGAGKSTLMKIALGAQKPTEGEVRIGGCPLTYSRPAEARTLGLGMVMQERSLIMTMTGIDNLFLNAERLNALGCVSLRRERAEIEGVVQQLGINPATLSMRVSDLRPLDQELIEIARALHLANRVLVLDEPTAPLGQDEVNKLFDVLRIVAARGTGVALITHHLGEVFDVSDEVTCLRDGNVVLSCPTRETGIADLTSVMLGRGASPLPYLRRSNPHYEEPGMPSVSERVPALTVRHLRVGTTLCDVSFDTFAGEILGIVGLAGSGRSTLLRTLFGDVRSAGGELCLFGKSYRPEAPADAIARGVFLVPTDRAQALLLSKSITENVILVILRRLLNRWRFLNVADARERVRQMMKTLEIRASGADQPVDELSGGNQQKVVLAKALTVGSRLLLLDEPTVGVDIASRHEIMTQVRNLADTGSAVLWVSSDLQEIIQVSDRIAILRDGIVYATINREGRRGFNEHSLSEAIQAGQSR